MTQIMKKKIISVVLGFFVVVSTLFTILALNITPVTLKRDIFEYEYGSVISNNPADYVNANESVINEVKLNFSNLKNEIGLYKVSATYAGVELPFYIKIKDTTKPVFTLKQVVFNINVNEKIAALNLIDKVEDQSDTKKDKKISYPNRFNTLSFPNNSIEAAKSGPCIIPVVAIRKGIYNIFPLAFASF